MEVLIEEPKTSSKGSGCGAGLLVLVMIAFGLGVPVMIFYVSDVRGQQVMHSTDERRFDPVQGYSDARRLVGDQEDFMSMRARFVRPDGTMDLAAEYEPTVRYRWRGAPSEDQRPVGAGGGGKRVEVVDVTVNDFGLHQTGQAGPETFYRFDLGFRRVERTLPHLGEQTVTDPPRCALSELWRHALDDGAPQDAVAVVDYDASGYTFVVEDTDVRMEFDAACDPVTR